MELPIDVPFGLGFTLDCGQVFRWKRVGGWWYGAVGGSAIKIRQDADVLIFHTGPEELGVEFVRNYFRLDDDLPRIYAEIRKDAYVDRAIQEFYGMRIARQDPWECLISYMCATFKNIPAIRTMILRLSERFGRRLTLDGHEFYTFPTADVLADADLDDLKACGLGFRARYVLEVAKKVDGGDLDLGELGGMGYSGAKDRLLRLCGVGPKVADCVLLYSLGFLNAFPVDLWVERAAQRLYFGGAGVSPAEIRGFAEEYFGGYAGYAQLYLYYGVRKSLF
ncbi:MAG: DNA-3-methyladenine glycosylase family protein [Candidatus Bathyarchaeia archaeon]